MAELNIRVSQMQAGVPVAVMHLDGDIDAHTHVDLDNQAAQVVADGARSVLLDMSGTNYMSSAGFRSMHKLMTVLSEAGAEKGSLKLLNPSQSIKGLMKAMGFDLYIDTFDDLQDAISAF